MPNFYSEKGVTVLGSRLRQISERITQDNRAIFMAAGLDIEPRWFPILTTLAERKTMRVGELAQHIRLSDAATSQVLAQLRKAGHLTGVPDPSDRRSSLVSLTESGQRLAEKTDSLCVDVSLAAASLVTDTGQDMMSILASLDQALSYKSLPERMDLVQAGEPVIVDYEPKYRLAFQELNYAWINRYFKVEAQDIEQLDNPEVSILEPGGAILVAVISGKPLGVCALDRKGPALYELSKMAVDPSTQGKGIGYLLGRAIITRAWQRGGKVLELESNTVLEPAINLYRKLGFEEIPIDHTPYARCNIKMRLNLQVLAEEPLTMNEKTH